MIDFNTLALQIAEAMQRGDSAVFCLYRDGSYTLSTGRTVAGAMAAAFQGDGGQELIGFLRADRLEEFNLCAANIARDAVAYGAWMAPRPDGTPPGRAGN